MIAGQHARIRTAEMDDAPVLQRLYDAGAPRAALLDARLEPALPTRDELRELLSNKDTSRGQLFCVEDMTGRVSGFCTVRGAHPEGHFAEAGLLLVEEAEYASGLADEAMAFLKERAFRRMGLNKLFTQCLDSEKALRACLLRHGFRSDGARREAFYGKGRMHDLEAFSLFARDAAAGGGQ